MKLPNIKGIMGVSKAFMLANRPELLFGASIASTLGAVVTAGFAGYKSGQQVLQAELDLSDEELEEQKSRTVDVKEKIQLTWLNYLPAAGLTGAALGSTTGLHIVHVKEKKAIAAAALMAIEEVRQDAVEYKDNVLKTVKETVTEKQGEKVDAALSEKGLDQPPPSATMVTADSLYLVTDLHTGRPFYSTESKIQQAANEINRKLQDRDVELNDFYVWAGFQEIKDGNDYGWNQGDFITISFEDSHLEDGRPTREFTFQPKPRIGFDASSR